MLESSLEKNMEPYLGGGNYVISPPKWTGRCDVLFFVTVSPQLTWVGELRKKALGGKRNMNE
jgi:hypothetical protein